MNNQGFFVKHGDIYCGPYETLNEARTNAGHGTNLPIYHGILKEDNTFIGSLIPKTGEIYE